MINLFDLHARAALEDNYPMEADIQSQINMMKLESDASHYIFHKYMDVTDYVRPEDRDALRYVDRLYSRVIKDTSVKAEDRSINNLLDEVEKDMEGEKEEEVNISFVLNFLEASLIVSAKRNSTGKREKFALGRIYRLKKNSFRKVISIGEKSKPMEIKEYIDQYVIGQDDAKIAISTAVYNHMKRKRNPGITFPTDVVLLIGPSGCGKTEIMRRIRDITNLPMVFTDVSSLGVSQTKGRHKEDILISLLNEANGDMSVAEHGIIFMDEFDKVLVPAFSSEGEDVHARVQGQLLTMLEGSDVEIRYRGSDITFNTNHILFVLAGAFEGIDTYIKKRAEEEGKTNVGIGFTSVSSKELDASIIKENINHRVLVDYGMKKELAGRIEDIAVLESLKKEDYLKILKESQDNVISKYRNEIMTMCGAYLQFDDEAIEVIVERVLNTKIGARALTTEVRKIMREVLYEAPTKKGYRKVIITKDTAEGTGEAIWEE